MLSHRLDQLRWTMAVMGCSNQRCCYYYYYCYFCCTLDDFLNGFLCVFGCVLQLPMFVCVLLSERPFASFGGLLFMQIQVRVSYFVLLKHLI